MAANLYDYAHELEKALRNSAEFGMLKDMYQKVNEDESAKNMFNQFREIQMKLQEKQLTNQEITEEEVLKAQQSAALVQQNEKIGKLMEAEQRLSMTINELNKIIMKPLEELYGPLTEQE